MAVWGAGHVATHVLHVGMPTCGLQSDTSSRKPVSRFQLQRSPHVYKYKYEYRFAFTLKPPNKLVSESS